MKSFYNFNLSTPSLLREGVFILKKQIDKMENIL